MCIAIANGYYVPEDMSYEEWKRKFVDGEEDNETIKGAIVNSVGAKSPYYPNLKWDGDGENIEYVQGSKPFYPKNHLMAGYGTNKKIRDIERLNRVYGVPESESHLWQKDKMRYEVYDEYGEIRIIEVHFYKHPNVGRVEDKVKTQSNTPFVDEWAEWE